MDSVKLTGVMGRILKLGGFGAVAGVGVLFFASGIPRVKTDILQKLPVIGSYFIEEIPASDNVRYSPSCSLRCPELTKTHSPFKQNPGRYVGRSTQSIRPGVVTIKLYKSRQSIDSLHLPAMEL